MLHNVKLHIWYDTLNNVYGKYVIVDFRNPITETELNEIDKALHKTFSQIWDVDEKRIHILTDQEFLGENEPEDYRW